MSISPKDPIPLAGSPGLSPDGQSLRWRTAHWLVLWLLVGGCQVALLAGNATMDTFLWRTTRWFTGDQGAYRWGQEKARYAADPGAPFYRRIDPPMTRTNKEGVPEARFYRRTESFWRVTRDLGEPAATLLIILLVWTYDPRRWKAAAQILCATAGAGIVSWLLRATAGRYRPVVADGANRWEFLRGFHDGSNLSWPSGHATLAFAAVAVLCYLSPKGRGLFLAVAGCCAVARVVMQAHFYSDIILGAALGWTLGWFITQAMDKVMAGPATPRGT